MAFDFPTTPSAGTIYAPSGGPTYRWDGLVWSQLGVPFQGALPSDTPPPNPVPGQLWWETDTGALFCYYNDGNSSQWVQVQGGGGLQSTAEARNRIVNGNGAISQELGDTPTTASTSHIADQWQYHYVGPSVSGSRFTGPVSPDGSLTRMVLNVTVAKSSLAAGDIVQIYQLIEGIRVKDFQWGTASAKQVVLRFMFRSAVAGIYCAAIRNAAYDRSWIGSFNIPTADTNTVVTLVVPGDTTGTWPKDNTHGLNVVFTFACGTTYQGITGWQAGDKRGIAGMANAASVVSSSSAVTDVGLYLDPNATGVAPPWQMPDYADEYELCERYWQTGPGTAHATVWTQTSWPVRMRAATPAITFSPAISNAQAFAVSYSFSHGTTTAFTFYANARM